VTAAIFMTVVEGFRPTWRSVRSVLLWAHVYGVVIFVFNMLTGSNYLYISRKLETASVLDVLGPWPWYLIPMECIGLAVC